MKREKKKKCTHQLRQLSKMLANKSKKKKKKKNAYVLISSHIDNNKKNREISFYCFSV